MTRAKSGSIILIAPDKKEHEIKSKVQEANVTGTHDLDYSLYSIFKLTMTGACVFSEINVPTGDEGQPVTLWLTGDFPPTFPAYWDINGDTYDGLIWNKIIIDLTKGDTSSEFVDVEIINRPTA